MKRLFPIALLVLITQSAMAFPKACQFALESLRNSQIVERPIDLNTLEQWIRYRHPPDSQRKVLADFIGKVIREGAHISHQELLHNYAQSLKNFIQHVTYEKKSRIVFINNSAIRTTSGEGKSSYWMLQLLATSSHPELVEVRQMLKNFEVDLVSIDYLTSKEYKHQGRREAFVMIDDAAYSGEQLRGTLDHFLLNLQRRKRSFLSFITSSEAQVHLVVPFTSSQARQKLSSPNELIFLHTNYHLSSYGEVLGKMRGESKKRIEKAAQEVWRNRASYFLQKNFQYFDHKVADGVSLNGHIVEGTSLGGRELTTHRFYPDFKSPYEQMQKGF